ncbi:hypothetical protein PGTUg99_022498 [Puccinia graminis f. sp. tritici]|uniref:Uncharacterized protein n=1 Tax=Puccinia graminis f. sp. tritici TaxID=56615 RepID=A0A5B0SJN6_PUCGR|nr:hypothetical protein PGTUg99_022498 [Puccinia graminis f. sp. tritici]
MRTVAHKRGGSTWGNDPILLVISQSDSLVYGRCRADRSPRKSEAEVTHLPQAEGYSPGLTCKACCVSKKPFTTASMDTGELGAVPSRTPMNTAHAGVGKRQATLCADGRVQ